MHKKQQAAIQPMLSFGQLAFHKTPALKFDPATTLKQVCYLLPLNLRLSWKKPNFTTGLFHMHRQQSQMVSPRINIP